jgi:hypothetical protein
MRQFQALVSGYKKCFRAGVLGQDEKLSDGLMKDDSKSMAFLLRTVRI